MADEKSSPYKGVPRSEWARVKEEQRLLKNQRSQEAAIAGITAHAPPPPADAFAPPPVEGLPSDAELAAANAQQQREAPPAPRLNSDSINPEAIPPDLFSGTMKTLEVYGLNGSTTDPIPGYRLYWFNDHGGSGVRINQARTSGWEFVKNDEIALTENLVGGNIDPGSNVCKIVNPHAVPPMKAYLMKKPLWLNDAHMAQREQQHRKIEEALALGRVPDAKPSDRQYSRRDDPTSSLPKIDISSHLYR